jgi:TolB-like protein
MAEERVDRRLAAIFASDIASYSRLMGGDEEGTLRQLKAHRKELVDPKFTEHRGRIVKTTGDGMLVEFVSVVDAVRCAVDIQRGMVERNADLPAEKRIEFRIGINVGDIISDDNDIYGDGVNVAARLEALAEPGGIMVSRTVHDQVRDKLSFGFEDMGERTVKNIARPIGVHRVFLTESVPQTVAKSRSAAEQPDVLTSSRPSIAVLPFANMSGDPEQEYFADGIVEEIITALSHMRWLSVIARNSSFTYKGKSVDLKQVGRDLNVRYILEGSVRKSGNRVRITGQLIDTATGAHFWADRFDGAIEDIFDLQDQVTAKVISAIAPKLEQAEIERAKRKPTESLDAYDYFLRGMASLHQWTKESNDEALRLFSHSIELAAVCLGLWHGRVVLRLAQGEWLDERPGGHGSSTARQTRHRARA